MDVPDLWLKMLPITGWGAQPPYLLGVLPNTLSLDFLKFAILPAFVLGYNGAGTLARMTRASLLESINQDYIRTARAKGLPEWVVVVRHALRNSLIPVATVIGPGFAGLVTGSFVIEIIFGIPGMGKYFVFSINNRDYAVIMGTILLYAIILIIANVVVDITYAYLDPRIRLT
jgi:ABC-type dipeptide/oligopeptide/nickel transport system permease component